jgi:hypothetical protein
MPRSTFQAGQEEHAGQSGKADKDGIVRSGRPGKPGQEIQASPEAQAAR